MCLAQGPQRSDAGEARTRGPSVSSQALYHWATALPCDSVEKVWNGNIGLGDRQKDTITLVNVYVDLVVFTRIAGTT